MSYLTSLVSESVGRREGNLEVTARLEGKVENEGPEERMGSPHTEKPDSGSDRITGQEMGDIM